jgi:hypothetical protein
MQHTSSSDVRRGRSQVWQCNLTQQTFLGTIRAVTCPRRMWMQHTSSSDVVNMNSSRTPQNILDRQVLLGMITTVTCPRRSWMQRTGTSDTTKHPCPAYTPGYNQDSNLLQEHEDAAHLGTTAPWGPQQHLQLCPRPPPLTSRGIAVRLAVSITS